MTQQPTSSSKGTNLCLHPSFESSEVDGEVDFPSSPSLSVWLFSVRVTTTAAWRIGVTRISFSSLGWNWTFNTGEGKRNFRSHSPEKKNQSRGDIREVITWAAQFVLPDRTSQRVTVLSVEAETTFLPDLDQERLQTGWTWAWMILAIPRVKKSHTTIRPSLQPTARSVPYLRTKQATPTIVQLPSPLQTPLCLTGWTGMWWPLWCNPKYHRSPRGSSGQNSLYWKQKRLVRIWHRPPSKNQLT